MNWYLDNGSPIKVNGDIATHVNCCCPTTCECAPCSPLVACLASASCRLDRQKISLSSVTPDSGYCRQFSGSITLDCCSKTLEIKIRWINNAAAYTDVDLGWRYNGGAWSYTTANAGSCSPFNITFNSFNLNDSACCPHGAEGIVVNISCPTDSCYCPTTLSQISGTIYDKINSCAVDGTVVSFTRVCPDGSPECRRMHAKCIAIPGCTDTIDFVLVWAAGGTDHNDITLYWKTFNSSGVLQTSGSTTPSDPPSKCDPLCLLFKGITLSSGCCSNTVELEIGDCVDCCCPQFPATPLPDLSITITNPDGLTGSGNISEGGVQTACVRWSTGLNAGDGISVSGDPDCAWSEIGLEIWCPPGSDGPEDMRLNIIDTGGIFVCPIPTNVAPDSSSCGPPFTATWTLDMSDEFCDCNIITIKATEVTTLLASASPPQPSVPPRAAPPPSVTHWLEGDI